MGSSPDPIPENLRPSRGERLNRGRQTSKSATRQRVSKVVVTSSPLPGWVAILASIHWAVGLIRPVC